MVPKQVCIQGLGFVGAAMAVAVASARSEESDILYQVTGIDQDTPQGRERVNALAEGVFPFGTTDESLREALSRCHRDGNLATTIDESVYAFADVVVIDIPLDIPFRDNEPQLDMAGFEKAFRNVSRRVPAGALILVETTVPPGTCERILLPILADELKTRGMNQDAVHLAHSYERVMPGEGYLESITRFWRVYAGANDAAADTCEAFLSSIIDVKKFPLSRLASMTASESAKLMENTYRAANIAFVDEWTKYAEAVGIDLYQVIEAIRVRPTHSNLRVPGLGVGGYCLTKDPAFAPAASRQLFDHQSLDFPFSRLAMQVNQAMPQHSVQRLLGLLGGTCWGKAVLLLGVSYRQDVSDTRFSPVEVLARALQEVGARVEAFDPFVAHWPEMNWQLPDQLPKADLFDAVVFATPHRQFLDLDLLSWLGSARPLVLDTVNVVSRLQRDQCRSAGVRIESIGRGDGL